MQEWFRLKFTRTNSKSPLKHDVLEDEICEAFGRLDTQAMTFVDSRSISVHGQMIKYHSDVVDIMLLAFTSTKESRFYIDVLMQRLMHFGIFNAQYHRDSMASAADSTETIAETPQKIRVDFAKHFFKFERWRAAASSLLNRLKKNGREKEALGATALEIYYLQTHTSLDAALGMDQMRFDRFLPKFKQIVAKCCILLATLVGDACFMIDFQCIIPLYIVARKCRDPVVRRDAITGQDNNRSYTPYNMGTYRCRHMHTWGRCKEPHKES
jgi:hypothetical protein